MKRHLGKWKMVRGKNIINKIDFGLMDELFEEATLFQREIALECGCSQQAVNARWRKLHPNEKYVCDKDVDAHPGVPFHPMDKRPQMALEARREALGMDTRTFEEIWLPAHRWTPERGFIEVRG